MFIHPNDFCIPKQSQTDGKLHNAVIIYSTLDQGKTEDLTSFVVSVKAVFKDLNKENADIRWNYQSINVINPQLERDCMTVYNADIIIIECTKADPNVFYMLGMAHARGCLVCPCYHRNTTIPFNVHGRQSMTYTVKSHDDQEKLKDNLKKWIKNYYPHG